MALAAMLSAVRTLILDTDELPPNVEGRTALYRTLFPALSELEIGDLSKIPVAQIKTYTSCIYNGERSTLKMHFPITFQYMERAWSSAYGEELDATSFAMNLHKRRPWKGNSTENLARNFVFHLNEDRPELVRILPALPELALLEFETLRLRRIVDPEFVGGAIRKSAPLHEMSVEELMSRNLVIVPAVSVHEFEHDVVKIFNLSREGVALPDTLSPARLFAVGSRTASNYVRWFEIPRYVYDALNIRQKMVPFEISELAESAVESYGDIPEEESFRRFFLTLSGLIENGAVAIIGE